MWSPKLGADGNKAQNLFCLDCFQDFSTLRDLQCHSNCPGQRSRLVGDGFEALKEEVEIKEEPTSDEDENPFIDSE